MVLLGMTALTACGGSESEGPAEGADSIADAAQDEGELVWYTSLPQTTVDAVLEGFTEETGIQAESVVLSTSLLTARLASEKESNASTADVVTAADPAFFAEAQGNEWFLPLEEGDVPALGDWPSDYLSEDAYALVNIQPAGITYNTDKVSEDQVDTWEELLDPSLKGEIFYCDPEIVPTWLAMLKTLREELGEDYVAKLGEQELEFVDSLVPGAQTLAAGSGSVLIPSLASVSKPLTDEGAPLATVFPTPTTGVEQFAGVLDDAPHPNAALVFIDYLLSEDGQTILNKDVGSSPLGDLEGTLPLPEGYEPPDINGAREEQDQLLALIGR
jgi:iron(III) transport system substrate-binding protein